MFRSLLIFFFVFGSAAVHAVVPVVDLNAFYNSDTFTYASTTSEYKKTLWDVTLGVNLDNRGLWTAGWSYASSSLTENPGTETSLAVIDMGPKIIWYLDKDRNWVLAFTYNLITKADYTSGATTSELRGNSMKVEAGYMQPISDAFLLGARINWYKPSFNEEIVGTTLSDVTHSRAVIYPSFALMLRWN